MYVRFIKLYKGCYLKSCPGSQIGYRAGPAGWLGATAQKQTHNCESKWGFK